MFQTVVYIYIYIHQPGNSMILGLSYMFPNSQGCCSVYIHQPLFGPKLNVNWFPKYIDQNHDKSIPGIQGILNTNGP